MIRKIFLIFLNVNIIIALECEDTCNIKTYDQTNNCFCSNCTVFDDCCSDKKNHSVKLHTDYECNTRIDDLSSIYTIGKCKSLDSNKITKCYKENQLIEKIPVYSFETGHFYKNIFCLICNIENFDTKAVRFFQIEPSNSEINNLSSELEIGNFSYTIKAPIDVPTQRYCIKSIDTCPFNYTNKTIIDLCSYITSYRYTKSGKVFKNELCALCNQATEDLFCYPQNQNQFSQISLQVLFDLSRLNNEIFINLQVINRNYFVYNQTIKFDFTKQDMIKKYLTIIGHLISITSLIVLLIIYFIKKLFINLPGKILVNLSLSLLFSQSFLLISIFLSDSNNFVSKRQLYNSVEDLFSNIKLIVPCFISSFLTHYFYLAFFAWSNIMAFDLYKMFEQSLVISKANTKTNFYKYFIIGWSLPLFLPILMILKNYNKLSYGVEKCFISFTIDILIFFIVPVSTIIIINLVLVVLSVRLVLKIDYLNQIYLRQFYEKNKHKKRFILFLKLFILTGLNWILGIINSLLNNEYSFLWYAYLFFNSFQGFFIMCSYLFNFNIKKYSKNNISKSN